jgi:hypothetical protein
VCLVASFGLRVPLRVLLIGNGSRSAGWHELFACVCVWPALGTPLIVALLYCTVPCTAVIVPAMCKQPVPRYCT